MSKLTPEEIAIQAIKAEPEKYYAEPFIPHKWVISAMKEYGAQEVAEKDKQLERAKELLEELTSNCSENPNRPGSWWEKTYPTDENLNDVKDFFTELNKEK